MQLEIKGKLENRIVDTAVDELLEDIRPQVEEHIREKVTEAVKESLEEAIKATVTETVTPMVLEIIKEGFPVTNQWGEKKGPNKTVATYVREQLTHTRRDRYGRDRTIVESLCAEMLDRELKNAGLSDEIKQARAAFRQQVDDMLAKELVGGLRAALGLKS